MINEDLESAKRPCSAPSIEIIFCDDCTRMGDYFTVETLIAVYYLDLD